MKAVVFYSINKNFDDAEEELQRALDLTLAARNEVDNARVRLDNTGFDDELLILEQYIKTLGGNLQLSQETIERVRDDYEITSSVKERSLEDHLRNLFKEMTLDLGKGKSGVVAVSGFTGKDGEQTALLEILDEMAIAEIAKLGTLTVVERNNLDKILEEQELALSDLMDTSTAIEIGKFLTADFIVTGSVIEMPNSMVIFGRIINVETAEIESAAQVIVPKEVITNI